MNIYKIGPSIPVTIELLVDAGIIPDPAWARRLRRTATANDLERMLRWLERIGEASTRARVRRWLR